MSLITVSQLKEELCDMRYVIRIAISHGDIKQQVTTVGSHECIMKNIVQVII